MGAKRIEIDVEVKAIFPPKMTIFPIKMTKFPKISVLSSAAGEDVVAGPRLSFPGGVTRQQAGAYICQAANQHRVMQVRALVEVVFLPSC